MANMRIYSQNILNTTTMLYARPTQSSDWTSTCYNYFDRKQTTLGTITWTSSSSPTYATMTITFTSSVIVDAIALKNVTSTNARILVQKYSGGTYTTLGLSGFGTTSAYFNNPSGDYLLIINSTTSISSAILVYAIPLTATTASISIGDIYVLELQHEFTDNPAVGDYKPKFDRTEYTHTMSDGGTATYVIQDNFQTEIKLKYVSASDRNALKTIYQTQEPIVFTPFPTGTGWDGEIYEVNWVEDFDLSYTDNYTGNGYNIKMKLKETPK